MKILTDETIQSLYERFGTPPHVRAHCRGVTDCATKLAKALMEADPDSCRLDLSLIYGAGMVHDMARKCDHHEEVAADTLLQMGYIRESEIVREHMRCNAYHNIDEVTEADLLYISDRMVLEDRFVGAEKRFEYLRNKMIMHGRDPDSEMARRFRENAFAFVAAIEAKTGRSIFEICGGPPEPGE